MVSCACSFAARLDAAVHCRTVACWRRILINPKPQPPLRAIKGVVHVQLKRNLQVLCAEN